MLDTERYEEVVFLQGDEANEAIDILNNDGQDAAMEYLKQWHNPGEHMGSDKPGHGTMDRTFSKDGYLMSWNTHIPYIGLSYDSQHGQEMDEDSQMMRHHTGQREKIGHTPLGKHSPHSQEAIGENIDLPENKPSINGKYKTSEAIKTSLYKLLNQEKVEGRYADENWQGISKLQHILHNNGIQFQMLDAKYEGQGDDFNKSNLPTRKVYKFKLDVRNRDGKIIPLNLKVNCAFVGKTGTMSDKEYELTFYFF